MEEQIGITYKKDECACPYAVRCDIHLCNGGTCNGFEDAMRFCVRLDAPDFWF